MSQELYSSGDLTETPKLGVFNRSLEIYGLKILGLKEAGGNVAVEDEFIKKVAQTFKLMLDPNEKDIDSSAQIKAIEKLKTGNTIQRIGALEYDSYNPILDTDSFYDGWSYTNDLHNHTDFIWQFNLPGANEVRTGLSQQGEVLEHLLHTYILFAFPGPYSDQFYWDDDSEQISGDLYEAAKEAIQNGVYNASSYDFLGKNSYQYWKTVVVEYQYMLTFAEWGFIERYTFPSEGLPSNPEWSNSHINIEKIKEDNPLGHNLYENYIKKIISKPSTTKLDLIFQDNNNGYSYYISDTSTTYATLLKGNLYNLNAIRDYDGKLHANINATDEVKFSYKFQGRLDVNNDDFYEAIFTNKESGRWVTASISNSTGLVDYSRYGQGGTTRVVGIYIDPLVESGDVIKDSDHDSQRRFQNDLYIDNLIVKTSGDFDSDGDQEVYWKTTDGTAYLRALMHADGNIQYANYQSEAQMSDYLTSNGFESVIAEII